MKRSPAIPLLRVFGVLSIFAGLINLIAGVAGGGWGVAIGVFNLLMYLGIAVVMFGLARTMEKVEALERHLGVNLDDLVTVERSRRRHSWDDVAR